MLASDRQLPISGGPEKRAYVRTIFAAIAPTYDRLNRIISFHFDQGWRRRAVKWLEWERAPEGIYLDLCAGTLDFGATLARQPGFRGRIIGADFVPQMLRLGLRKSPRLVPVTTDALDLPFPDQTFDGAMVGWGLRNLVDLDRGLAEAARILKPGARLVILEMATPTQPLFRRAFQFYFRQILPVLGRWISKHTTAYTWLPESTRVFPSPAELARRLRSEGFVDVGFELLMGGVCALYSATRTQESWRTRHPRVDSSLRSDRRHGSR